jgi:hypothetical protein
MAVSVLDTATGIGDNNTNPRSVSAGTDRYWLIAVQHEVAWTTIPSTITVSGTTSTTLSLIATATGGTINSALYGCNDAAIGTSPSTSNGSLTYNADGDTPASSGIVVASIVAAGVDQTTPFTNTVDVGYSTDSTNSTQNCPFTLDEVADGLGVAFVACSKTGTTWTLTDNSYAKNGDGQWVQGTATSGNCATKLITGNSSGVTTTLTTGLTGDKTSTLGIMLLPSGGAPAGPDVSPSGIQTMNYQAMPVQASNLKGGLQ